MEREAQLVDAFQEDGWSTGVVGRMLDKLQEHGMSVSANGIDGKGPMIEGNPSTGRTVDVIPSWGVNTLTRQSLTSQSNDIEGILDIMSYINEETDISSGIFANYWAQNLIDTLNRTDYLSELLGSTTLINDSLFTGSIGKKLDIVSRMILKHDEREVNRDAFYMTMGGFDGHSLSNEGLEGNLNVIEQGLRAFYKELTDQNMLDNVTVVVLSEFGRTISPNSGLGSDHAWGGNAFVFGGEVDGGKLLGKYPERLDDKDLLNIGRGRLIPSISWDSMWYGISNWFGIANSTELEYVLPNNGNMGCQLFSDKDMYVTGNTTVPGCNDRMVGMKLGMFIKEPRYLTGMEQKRICKAAIAKVAKRANVTSRCIVVDQKVIVYLQTSNATFSVEAEVALDYDDTDDQAGAEYIEDVTSFTADMNEELTGNCTEPCEFQIENVAEVTEFEAQVTEAPSMSPSTSSAPSNVPSNQPSHVPSAQAKMFPLAQLASIALKTIAVTPNFQVTQLDAENETVDILNSVTMAGTPWRALIVSGLKCDPTDRVVVTKICGQDVDHEVDYSSSSRLRRLSSDNNIVEFTVILIALTEDDVRQKDALLGQYLQGPSLDSIIADIFNEITTNGSTQTLSSITAIYYEFINSFIRGLGLYYPAWGGSRDTCLNDGNQPDYMNLQPDLWMTESLIDCCLTNAEATIISGSDSASIADSTANLYYPDWTGTNTCTTGDAPGYMKRQPEIWMYSTLEDCCKAYYDWDEGDYDACVSIAGGVVPTQVPVDGWYVKWDSFTCVRNCEGASPCGGIRKKWNVLHQTQKICCSEHLWWTGNDCTA
eukprot:scaffold19343_cov80-Cyclotella_meneghiniana.AAC.1